MRLKRHHARLKPNGAAACAGALALVTLLLPLGPHPGAVVAGVPLSARRPSSGAPARAGHASGGRTGVEAPANVLVAQNRTEPTLALDPRDGRTIVAAANPDYYHARPAGPLPSTLASGDDGASWAQGAVPAYGNFTGLADPSLAVDAAGRSYYLYMGETPTYCGADGNTALLLGRSDDGGRTFASPTVVDINGWDDKPRVAVYSTAGQAGQAGHTSVYAAFTRWLTPNRQIVFMRSTDDGHTFAEAPKILYASRGVNWGAVPLAGPHGRVYVLWARYATLGLYTPVRAQILLRASTDGGRAFAPPIVVADFSGLPRMLAPGAVRVFTYPVAAVDPRSGALYVAWVRTRPLAHPAYAGQVGADVMLARSRDGGHTWTQPVALNDAAAGDRFMPAISIGPDGVVRVAFYDRRVDGTRFGLYAVAARDEGGRLRVWPNRQVSAALSSPYTLHYIAPGSSCVAPGRFMGDYIGAATARDGALDAMWTDTTQSAPGESDIMFARVPDAYLRAGAPHSVRW